MKSRLTVLSLVCFTLSSVLRAAPAASSTPLSSFATSAEKFHEAVVLPQFERTPEEVAASTDKAIQESEAALTRLAQQDLAKVTFESTIQNLDTCTTLVRNTADRLGLLQETATEKALRDAASEASVKISSWEIGLEYREDIYQAIKAYADTHPQLSGEDKLLFDEILRDYRRAGLALAPEKRAEVERLRKELTQLTNEFNNHVNEARGPIDFTAEELAGVPSSFLESPGVRQPDGRYRVMANITWHAEVIAANATNEETRHRAYLVRYQLAKDTNTDLLAKIVAVRTTIAQRLGYATWADYQTEPRMAKTGATAIKFEEELVTGLQQKFTDELAELQKLKAEETKVADAKLEAWDIAYYTNQLKKQRYAVDTEALRVYFPYQATLSGMFRIYERIFGLTFSEVTPPQVWAPGVQLFSVADSTDGQPIGLFYLDMFPREGKYNHFACFPVMQGLRRADGTFEIPIASLVCNFPPPSADKPSLLRPDDVETLFHEFGHVMHLVLGRAKFGRHVSFGVPQDFVEAPSQMLENWPRDKAVLDTFAADYRDPSKKVPDEVIDAMKRARIATNGVLFRRQLALGLLDLALHTQTDPEAKVDVIGLTNDVIKRVSIPPPPGTAMVTFFGHLAGGYDAGYYGYLWSLAIAQDMASVFQASPDKFLDVKIGRRLRDEVYSAGASREVNESVERFLRRKPSLQPFLNFVGVEAPPEKKS